MQISLCHQLTPYISKYFNLLIESDYNKPESDHQQQSPSKALNQNETDEIPLDNEALKSKMIKDIKRIYGSKFDKLFVICL